MWCYNLQSVLFLWQWLSILCKAATKNTRYPSTFKQQRQYMFILFTTAFIRYTFFVVFFFFFFFFFFCRNTAILRWFMENSPYINELGALLFRVGNHDLLYPLSLLAHLTIILHLATFLVHAISFSHCFPLPPFPFKSTHLSQDVSVSFFFLHMAKKTARSLHMVFM